MKIISPRKWVEEISYQRSFEYEDMPGAGFSFDCDEHGNVDESKMNPCALDNYKNCLSGKVKLESGEKVIKYKGIKKYEHSYAEPAIGECNNCDNEVSLRGFTNTCDNCETDYNMSGQQLAPREQWGEETGESLSDILSIDSMSIDE